MSVLSEAAKMEIIATRIRFVSTQLVHMTVIACLALVASINGIVPKLMSARRAKIRVTRMHCAPTPSARMRANVKRDIQEVVENVCLNVTRLVSMEASA
jgi:hypothetical protein